MQNKQEINALNEKMGKLKEAIQFKNQMKAQQSMLHFAQNKQQLTNMQYAIERQKNLLIRERNNLNANIMRENINNQQYVSSQVLGMEKQKIGQIANNIAQQEALKNKLDADLEENTKDTKKGLLIAGGGAALLSVLQGAGGFIGTLAGTLAPVFVPLLAILAVIFAIKLIAKHVNNEQQKMKLTEAFEQTIKNINDKDYIDNFVKPYMDQLGNVDKDQNQVFQDMVGNLMKDAGMPEEFQKQALETANNFAKPYGLEHNEFLDLPDEQLAAMVNETGKQIKNYEEEHKKEVEKNKETSKGNNKQNIGNSFAEEVIKPAVQGLDGGIKKEKTGAKLAITGVNEKKGTAQPAQGGKMNKDKGVAMVANK